MSFQSTGMKVGIFHCENKRIMKNLVFGAAFAAMLSFASCTAQDASQTQTESQTESQMNETPLEGTKWRLVELNGEKVPALVNGKVPFLKIDSENGRYSAWAGCNGIGGELEKGAMGKIEFARGMSTMMACENMQYEIGLNKVLLAVDNYAIKDGVLSLNKARMAPLAKFEAISEAELAKDLEGEWEVDYIGDSSVEYSALYPNRKPTLVFDASTGKVYGNSSCNQYNTQFTLENGGIQFGEIMSTKMACEGQGEAVFFNNLKKVNKYSVNGTTLTLITGDIAIMRLQKK